METPGTLILVLYEKPLKKGPPIKSRNKFPPKLSLLISNYNTKKIRFKPPTQSHPKANPLSILQTVNCVNRNQQRQKINSHLKYVNAAKKKNAKKVSMSTINQPYVRFIKIVSPVIQRPILMSLLIIPLCCKATKIS